MLSLTRPIRYEGAEDGGRFSELVDQHDVARIRSLEMSKSAGCRSMQIFAAGGPSRVLLPTLACLRRLRLPLEQPRER
jgi:hypothetical protein